MTNLRILNAEEDCGIVGLNLVELNAKNNPKIKKINHMTNLRKLDGKYEL